MEDYTEDDWDWDERDDQSLEEMDMWTVSGHNVSFKTIITSGLNINNECAISGYDTNYILKIYRINNLDQEIKYNILNNQDGGDGQADENETSMEEHGQDGPHEVL